MIDYHKKIIPYLDGSLSKDETSEFEAFVMTHPEFEKEIKTKQNEIELIKSMIPSVRYTLETHRSIENEMKTSIFNLLKEEPSGLLDNLRIKWEDWINR